MTPSCRLLGETTSSMMRPTTLSILLRRKWRTLMMRSSSNLLLKARRLPWSRLLQMAQQLRMISSPMLPHPNFYPSFFELYLILLFCKIVVNAPSFGLYVKTFTPLGLYLLLFILCLYLSIYFYCNSGYAPVVFVPLLAVDILFHPLVIFACFT